PTLSAWAGEKKMNEMRTPSMNMLQQSRNQVLVQIETACVEAGREADAAQLLAVSKPPPTSGRAQMYQARQRAAGAESVPEAVETITALKELDIEWHFIGHVQRNKTKHLAENFAWVHGVDRLIIAERLSSQRGEEQPALNICIQVNIDGQDTKDGCRPDEVADLVVQISQLPNVRLRGLMVILAPNNLQAFADAKVLFYIVKTQHTHP